MAPALGALDMRQIFLFFFLMVSSIIGFSQNKLCDKTVTGQVLDLASSAALPFATVKIVGTDKGAVTDSLGYFNIDNICENEIHLEIRYLGYKSVIHHHDDHHAAPVIYLAADKAMLESIVVEDERSTKLESIAVQNKSISRLSIATSSIGELTGSISGVTMLKTGSNISKPMVHGLHSNRVLVINNGVRHAYQVWGDEHAPEIDPSHIDQIEIVKGAGTVKYGPEALGGVILYNSKNPEFDKVLNGSIVSSYQTNGRAPSGQVSISQGFHRFAWNVGGYATYQGDLNAPNYNLSNTGKREYGGSFNTFLHQPNFDLQISGSYFEQELGILRGSIVGNLEDLQNAIERSEPNPTWDWTYELQSPRQQTEHGMLKTDLSMFPGDHIINIQYALQRNIRREYDVRRGELNDRPIINLELLAHNIDTEWIQPSRGLWNGNSGIQLISQNSVNEPGSNPVNFVPDYDVFNVGAFTVQSLDVNMTTFELGLRFDFQSMRVADTIRDVFTYSNELEYANVNFTFGINKKLGENASVFSNIGSAWRPPNVAEIYSFGYHHSRLQFGLWRYNFDLAIPTPPDSVFDQSLREIPAERGIKWVSGLELRKKKTTAEFVFYANRINNYLFLRPYGITTGIAGTFPYFIYEQTDVLFLGSDWDIHFDHSPKLSSEVKLSYVYALSTEKNQALLEIPPFNLDYTFSYESGSWQCGINLNYTATQWNAPPAIDPEKINDGDIEIDINNDIFDFMSPPDDYLLVATNVGYHRKAWKVVLKVDNLINTSYRSYTDRLRYFADAPGRNFSLAVEFKF